MLLSQFLSGTKHAKALKHRILPLDMLTLNIKLLLHHHDDLQHVIRIIYMIHDKLK